MPRALHQFDPVCRYRLRQHNRTVLATSERRLSVSWQYVPDTRRDAVQNQQRLSIEHKWVVFLGRTDFLFGLWTMRPSHLPVQTFYQHPLVFVNVFCRFLTVPIRQVLCGAYRPVKFWNFLSQLVQRSISESCVTNCVCTVQIIPEKL